jgi:hypothetical protein
MNDLLQHALSYMLLQYKNWVWVWKLLSIVLGSILQAYHWTWVLNVYRYWYIGWICCHQRHHPLVLWHYYKKDSRLEQPPSKTYDHLHSVEYDKELNWLIPQPGNWDNIIILRSVNEGIFQTTQPHCRCCWQSLFCLVYSPFLYNTTPPNMAAAWTNPWY